MRPSVCFLVIFIASLNFLSAQMQNEKPTLYDETLNAKIQIQDAVSEASASGKHVFLQIGGNWCSWCIKFHDFVAADKGLDSLLTEGFVVRKINYSRENMNPEVMTGLGFPQRFGFPVFVILDGNGKQIHTQDSGYLEADKSYDRSKVERFFMNWSPAAFNADNYRVE